MAAAIRFRCLGCRARIKAPVELVNQVRNCPGCGTQLLIRPEPPPDSDSQMAIEHRPWPPARGRATARRVG
jgi:hypothetical protein